MAGIGHNSRACVKVNNAEQAIEPMHARRAVLSSGKPPLTKLIAIAIIEHMSTDTMTAYPSKSRLMSLCSVSSERTMRAHYRDALTFFEVTERPGKSSLLRISIEQTAAEIAALWKSSDCGIQQKNRDTPGKICRGLPLVKNDGGQKLPPVKNAGGREAPPAKIAGGPPVKNDPRQKVPPVFFAADPRQKLPPEVDIEVDNIYTSTDVDAAHCETISRSSHQVCKPAEPESNQSVIQLADSQQVSSGHENSRTASSQITQQAENNDLLKPKRSRSGIPDEYPKGFLEFWKLYPRRVGKADAFRAWQRLKLDQKQRAYAALKQQLPDLLAKQNGQRGNFCPHPATWINQGRFDDETETRTDFALRDVERLSERGPIRAANEESDV